MKADKITGAGSFTQSESVNRSADETNATPDSAPESKDQVTVNQEALRKAESGDANRVDTTIRTNTTKKPMPDPRYTAQAILDRELLGLKKFYS